MKQLLILGGSDAGISAGLRARELDPDWHVRIVLADRFPNYSICGLPFYLSGETPRFEDLAHRTQPVLEGAGIDLVMATTAEHIDASAHRVRVRGGDAGLQHLSYDRLIVCTGALPVHPPIRGLDESGVYLLHTMADAFALREHLDGCEPKAAVVIGGGYIGVEMADAFRQRGLGVTLCDSAPAPLSTIDLELGLLVQEELERNGVTVRLGKAVQAIEGRGDKLVVLDAGGETAAGDFVLVATGVRPASELAAQGGVEIGQWGAIRVNRRMQTNLPDVLAAGDCVETYHRLLERTTYLPLGTTAHKQGRVAGENAIGGSAQFEGSLGTQVVKVFGRVVGRTGFRQADALQAGFSPRTTQTTVSDHKAYYPGASKLHLRVTGDHRTRRLLGAQLLGTYGAEVSKRLDLFAMALHGGMTIDALPTVDLSYTPPLGSPWDAIQLACMEWLRAEASLL